MQNHHNIGDFSMNKQILCLALAVVFLTACGDKTNTKAPSNTPSELPKTTIGVSMNDVESKNDFLKTTFGGFRTAAQENPQITLMLETAAGDQDNQPNQAMQLIEQGVQALVINAIDPTNPNTPKMVDDLCAKNIPVVYFNRDPSEKNLAKCPSAYLITGDDVQAATQQGIQVLTDWSKNPAMDKNKDGIIQYAIIQTREGVRLTNERTKWVSSTLETYPKLGQKTQLLFKDYADFSAILAEEVVDKWVADPNFAQVEVIVGNTDDVALGALNSIKKHGITLPVYGADGMQSAFESIKNGGLAGTVSGSYDKQAKYALQMAVNLANNRPATEGLPNNYIVQQKTVSTPFVPVNKDNVDEFLTK